MRDWRRHFIYTRVCLKTTWKLRVAIVVLVLFGIAATRELWAAGIARRIAHLTTGQEWPDVPPPGIALFTARAPEALHPALARFGLTDIQSL